MLHFQLFWFFFLIGCFSFGGGYAMLPLIDRQVTEQGWMTTAEFTDAIAISGMLPGSIGLNAATFVGYQTAGLMGAIGATVGIVLPSFLLIIFIANYLNRFKENKMVVQAFYGLKPVIVGLILYSALKFTISLEVLTEISWESVSFIVLFLLGLLFLYFRKGHPVLIIFLSGLCGIILFH